MHVILPTQIQIYILNACLFIQRGKYAHQQSWRTSGQMGLCYTIWCYTTHSRGFNSSLKTGIRTPATLLCHYNTLKRNNGKSSITHRTEFPWKWYWSFWARCRASVGVFSWVGELRWWFSLLISHWNVMGIRFVSHLCRKGLVCRVMDSKFGIGEVSKLWFGWEVFELRFGWKISQLRFGGQVKELWFRG